MTREEADELVERIPFINTNALKFQNEKIKVEMYRSIAEKEDYVEWVMVIKDEYLRTHDETARRFPTDEEKQIAMEIKQRLYRVLAQALEIDEEYVESYIEKKISEDW